MLRRVAMVSYHTSPLALPGRGDSGGMNVYVRELALRLGATGLACDVFTRRSDPDEACITRLGPGARCVAVPAGPPRPLSKDGLEAHVGEFATGLAACVEEGAYDAVHSHYWLSARAALDVAGAGGPPVVHTAHTLALTRALPDGGGARLEAEIAAAREAAVLVAHTAHEAEILARRYGADPERVEIIPPGVDHRMFFPRPQIEARAELGLADTDLVVLYLGRIQRLKGADLALGALLELCRSRPELASRITLLVVGGPSGDDGEDTEAELHRLAADVGMCADVRFFPARSHESIASFHQAADVCIVPSRSESFGLAALEAMACGVPVVAASVDGLCHLVTHEESGLLVRERTPDGFAAALGRVLGDEELRARFRRGARLAAAPYSWGVTASAHRAVYSGLTAPAGRVVCG